MEEWIFYTGIDFSDGSIQQYHIDTRDFHCFTNKDKSDKTDFEAIKKYPERFFHTASEVEQLLTRFLNESGGIAKWRFFMLNSTNGRMNNWNMKYIRIHRTELGLVVCDNNHYALNKEILSCKVNQEHLKAH